MHFNVSTVQHLSCSSLRRHVDLVNPSALPGASAVCCQVSPGGQTGSVPPSPMGRKSVVVAAAVNACSDMPRIIDRSNATCSIVGATFPVQDKIKTNDQAGATTSWVGVGHLEAGHAPCG